jgi:replication factor A1
MEVQLTPGMCTRLHEASPDDAELWESKPTLQFLSVKKLGQSGPERADRYRIIISDGTHFLQAMLATQLNELVQNDVITKNSIVTVDKMICNVVSGKQCVPYYILAGSIICIMSG